MTDGRRPILLQVISGLRKGGAEHALTRLAEHGVARSFDMHVLSLEDDGVFGDRLRAAGATVHALELRRFPTTAWGRMTRLVREIRPRLLQGWMYHGNIGALIAARAAGPDIPLLWNIRQGLDDLGAEKRLTRMAIRLNGWFSRRPDQILYNSLRSRSQHETFGFHSGHARVIPNGFDLQTFAADASARARLRSELGLSQTAILVGHFARFHPMKDHACLLRAAHLVLGHDVNIHFVIAGSGVTSESIGLAAHVEPRFHQNIHIFDDRTDVPGLMQAIDLYVSSSSRGEGFPNVIGEAMASSRPCVGTDVGDTAYVVGDCGVIVPPRRPEALAGGILQLAHDPVRRFRLGDQARQKIQSQFAIDRIVGQYVDLYTAML